MAKKKFYSLCRYFDNATDTNPKIGYLLREGFNVPNSFGFDLAVYRAKNEEPFKDTKIWYVVDTRTGLSVAQGRTKNEAIENTLTRLEKIDMTKYNEKVVQMTNEYGPCPGHRISYNLINT